MNRLRTRKNNVEYLKKRRREVKIFEPEICRILQKHCSFFRLIERDLYCELFGYSPSFCFFFLAFSSHFHFSGMDPVQPTRGRTTSFVKHPGMPWKVGNTITLSLLSINFLSLLQSRIQPFPVFVVAYLVCTPDLRLQKYAHRHHHRKP